MFRRLGSIALFLTLTSLLFSQALPEMDMDMITPLNTRYMDQNAKILAVQSYLIEQIFTKPMFEKNENLFPDDDDGEENFFSSSTESKMVHEMMSRQLARSLAERDLLQLNKRYGTK